MAFEAELSTLTPRTAQKVRQLLRYARRRGIRVARIDSAHRTCAQQNALYASGITPARGCRSWHTWGRAVDLYIPGAYDSPPAPGVLEQYRELGDFWKRLGGKWGGDFGYVDAVHFEWHPEYDTVVKVCPDPTAQCPVPPWPEDRPLWARPVAWGALLALGGVGGAVYFVRARA